MVEIRLEIQGDEIVAMAHYVGDVVGWWELKRFSSKEEAIVWMQAIGD